MKQTLGESVVSPPKRPTQAVILAGGLGTRLRPLTDHLPKPMIAFHGKPFAAYLVEMLKEQGFEEIVFLLGYLPEVVSQHFGDGERYGLRIKYSTLPVEAETGRRLREALPLLDEHFLLMYCDNYWPLQFEALWELYLQTEAEGLITVYLNEDGYTKNNVKVSAERLVEIYDKSRTKDGLQGVDIGFAIFPRRVVEALPAGNISFERAVYEGLVAKGKLAAHVTQHRYYSVGGFPRLPLTEEFLRRIPTIFLDRDGVLNERAPQGEYICTPKQFIWLPGALEALRLLKQAGYRIFIISNQAGIARGKMTEEDLEKIHRKMIEEAGTYGGTIDRIYYCPHHWDENCQCRKPKPGMLLQAQRDHHLDLSRIWFLGDDERDMEAGKAAGCRTGLVTAETTLLDWVETEFTRNASL